MSNNEFISITTQSFCHFFFTSNKALLTLPLLTVLNQRTSSAYVNNIKFAQVHLHTISRIPIYWLCPKMLSILLLLYFFEEDGGGQTHLLANKSSLLKVAPSIDLSWIPVNKSAPDQILLATLFKCPLLTPLWHS